MEMYGTTLRTINREGMLICALFFDAPLSVSDFEQKY